MKKNILYFSKAGPTNTGETLREALERANELGIKDIVIATAYGDTALKASRIFDPKKFNLVAVTLSEGFMKSEKIELRDEAISKMKEVDIKVLTGTHSLGQNVNSAFTDKFGGKSLDGVVKETLYRFCQGMKVCVEIVLMAADVGLIPINREVIAIAGTERGADTAIVVKPAYPRTFLDFKILEIIAKPREPT